MPGRRVPRRPYPVAQAIQTQTAFPGGLSGSTTVPAPARRDGGWNVPGKTTPQVLFYQEEFVITIGAEQLTLTYLPIAYSEHVYLCRGQDAAGMYQREGVAWRRDAGKREIEVLPGMGAWSGDTVVVEYAYYPQPPGGAPPKIWWTFDTVSGSNSGTLGTTGAGSLSGGIAPAPAIAPDSSSALSLQPGASVQTALLSGAQLGAPTGNGFPSAINGDFWLLATTPGDYFPVASMSAHGASASTQARIFSIAATSGGMMTMYFGSDGNFETGSVSVPMYYNRPLHIQFLIAWDPPGALPSYPGQNELIPVTATLIVDGVSQSVQWLDRPESVWGYGSYLSVGNYGQRELVFDAVKFDWSTYMVFASET